MSTSLSQQGPDALLAALDCNRERARERYDQLRQHLIDLNFMNDERPEVSADSLLAFIAQRLASDQPTGFDDVYPYVLGVAKAVSEKLSQRQEENAAFAATQGELPTIPSSAEFDPPLEHLRHFLQTRFPVLYAQVLEPTLADLRLEYSATLAEGHSWKARRVLLQGYCALAAAAVCQFGYSLLGRIAALWRARSPK